jgi:hypothetical protein
MQDADGGAFFTADDKSNRWYFVATIGLMYQHRSSCAALHGEEIKWKTGRDDRADV